MAGRNSSLARPGSTRWWLPLSVVVLVIVLVLAIWWQSLPQLPPAAAVPDTTLEQQLAAIERNPHLADGYRDVSQTYQAAGQIDDAIALWEKAVKANPGQTWPLLELGQTYEGAGQFVQARDAYYQAASLNPQDNGANAALARTAERAANEQAIKGFLAARQPGAGGEQPAGAPVLMERALPNGWTFLGYAGDTAALVAGQKSALWTFWRAPSEDAVPSVKPAEWQPLGADIWARQAVVTNRLSNGSFEGALTKQGPDGFPSDRFAAAPEIRQVRRLVRDGEFTAVAALANDRSNRNSSFVSSPLPVKADTVLIVAADASSEDGNPGVGWSWPATSAESGWPLPANAVAAGASGDWQRYAGLALPPPNTGSIQVELQNTDSKGTAFFDNVMAVAVDTPAPLWPLVTTASALTDMTGAAGSGSAAQAVTGGERTQRFAAMINRYLAYPAIVDDAAWQKALGANGPLTVISQTLSSGWTIQGFSMADERQLVRGGTVPLVLYWQGPEGAIAGTADDGWFALPKGSWLQFLPAARSSLADGTFESGLGAWPGAYFVAPAASRQLSVTVRSGLRTTVGVLANSPAFPSTGLISAQQPVGPDLLFLETGWMRSDNGNGYIGYQWAGDIDPANQPFNRYVVAAGNENAWRRFAGIAEPLPGTQQVEVHLLNYQSPGTVYFDDIAFVPIPAPQPIPGSNERVTPRIFLADYAASPQLAEEENWLTQVAAAGPARLLDQGLEDGWTLLGYSADEEALAAGAVAPVFYFWQGPLGEVPGTVQDGWYSIDAGTWLQIDRTSSLLAGRQRLALPEPAAAKAVTISDRRMYLQAARVTSHNGLPVKFGITWQGELSGGQSTTTQFVAANIRDKNGKPVAGLLAAPAGARTAQVLLSGYNAAAEADASELLLLPVKPPAALAPAVGAAKHARIGA